MASRPRAWAIAALSCLLLVVVRHAAAEGPSPAAAAQQSATARALFEEGLKFVGAKDWTGAEERFRRVLAIKSSHVAAYNLASALDHLGRPSESAELLRAILRDATAPEDTRAAARQLLDQVEPRVGTVTIHAAGDSTDCAFTLDDRPLDASAVGSAISVDPGSHVLVVRRDDAVLAERKVRVGGKEPLRVEIAIDIPARAGPKPEPVPPAAPVIAPMIVPETAPPAPEPAPTPVDESLARPAPLEESRDEGGSVFGQWWFWAGAGAVAVAAVAIAVVASRPTKASPIAGDTDPPVIRGVVVGAMP